jgi:hypothetical protein
MTAIIQEKSSAPSGVLDKNARPNHSAGQAPSAEKAAQAVSESIWNIYSNAGSRREFLHQVLQALGDHFNSPYGVMVIESNTGTQQIPYEPVPAAVPVFAKRCNGPLLDARYRQLAAARFFIDPVSKLTFAIFSCPLSVGGEGVIGAISLIVPCENKSETHARLQSLQTLVALTGAMAVDVGTKAAKTATAKGGDVSSASKVAGYQTLQEFAFAVTNNLKAKLGCESVSFGLVRGSRVKLLCVSGTSHVDPRSLGTQQLEQVMEECLDSGKICCFQNSSHSTESGESGHLLHRKFHTDSSGAAIASIPLFVDERCVAILCLRQVPNQDFMPEQLEKVRELATPLMPGALLLGRAERNLSEHVRTDTLQWLKHHLLTDSWTRRLTMGAMLATAIFVLFGQQTYMLSIPCSIAPAEEVQLAAPFEGVIREALVRSGDTVHAGQLLVRMDTQKLLLDKQKAASDLATAEIESMQGAHDGDLTRTALGKARADAARCQLEKIKHSLALSDLRAPSDGTILNAELEKRIGETVPLGEPLIQFAPAHQWKIQLEVPEFISALVSEGQTGAFAAIARPSSTIGCELRQPRTTAEVLEGRNVFVVDASFTEPSPDWLRSGMEGSARINVGRHAVWWVWMHRAIDSVRVYLWKM